MTEDAFALVACGEACHSLKNATILACADMPAYKAFERAYGNVYAPLCREAVEKGVKKLYVPDLDLPDKQIDELIDYTLSGGVKLAVACSQTLESAGRIDARFSRSPVMLLHEFGLLEHSAVISGVYLDKDDLSLMAQENVPLVVLPSCDAGHGYGVAPVCAALERGVRVKIGTGKGLYNPRRSVLYEAALLEILTAAQMNKQSAVAAESIAAMCLPDGCGEEEIKETVSKIKAQLFFGGI